MTRWSIESARCRALFVSPLQESEPHDAERVRAEIVRAIQAFGGRGCAALMAQEFGDHPERAVARMRWVRRTVAEVFSAGNAPRPPLRRTVPAPAESGPPIGVADVVRRGASPALAR